MCPTTSICEPNQVGRLSHRVLSQVQEAQPAHLCWEFYHFQRGTETTVSTLKPRRVGLGQESGQQFRRLSRLCLWKVVYNLYSLAQLEILDSKDKDGNDVAEEAEFDDDADDDDDEDDDDEFDDDEDYDEDEDSESEKPTKKKKWFFKLVRIYCIAIYIFFINQKYISTTRIS